MNILIKNITLGELAEYLKSEECRTNSFVPISQIRALSHMNNPRGDENDYCLFLAYDDNKLIGYVGTLSDFLFVENSGTKVFWWSCLWVLPEYRRHGIAMKLLQNAYDLLNGNIVITNYHRLSKFTFDKTGHYTEFNVLNGFRSYTLFDLHRIVVRKYPGLQKFAWILTGIDSSVNFFLRSRLNRIYRKTRQSCSYQEVKKVEERLANFIQHFTAGSIFKRGDREFQWMIDYPWVIKSDKPSVEAERYYFSQEGTDFKQWFIKVEDKNRIVGFIMLTRFKGELKIPYSFIDSGYEEDVALYLCRLIIKERIPTLLCYNSRINELLKKRKFFIYQRKSEQGFLISKRLLESIKSNNKLVFAGDGDNAFV